MFKIISIFVLLFTISACSTGRFKKDSRRSPSAETECQSLQVVQELRASGVSDSLIANIIGVKVHEIAQDEARIKYKNILITEVGLDRDEAEKIATRRFGSEAEIQRLEYASLLKAEGIGSEEIQRIVDIRFCPVNSN